jgi:hypothetical protein
MSILYYQESGKADPIRLALSYVALGILGLTLGVIYVYCETILPIIYLNIVVTAGFSVALGLISLISFRLSHNRNKRSQLIQCIVFVLIAYYSHWTAYLFYAGHGHPPDFGEYIEGLSYIFHPGEFFYYIGQVNYYGLWSVFGIEFKGIMLAIVWILEAAIIIGGPIAVTIRKKAYPYSEAVLKWYPKFTLSRDFESVVATESFLNELSKDPIEAIQKLDKGTAIRYCKIQVFYLKDEDNQYLTFERVTIEGQGKGSKDTDIVINNFRIDRITAERLLDTIPHKRERAGVF